MARTLPGPTSKSLPQARDRDRVPGRPHDWDRRLSEARAKREAVLKQRAAERTGEPAEARPEAETIDADPLTAIAALLPRGGAAGRGDRPRRAWSRRLPALAAAWRRPLPTFVAGCLLGALATGLIALGVRAAWDPAAPAGLEAGAAEAGLAPAQPAGDTAPPAETPQAARTASAAASPSVEPSGLPGPSGTPLRTADAAAVDAASLPSGDPGFRLTPATPDMAVADATGPQRLSFDAPRGNFGAEPGAPATAMPEPPVTGRSAAQAEDAATPIRMPDPSGTGAGAAVAAVTSPPVSATAGPPPAAVTAIVGAPAAHDATPALPAMQSADRPDPDATVASTTAPARAASAAGAPLAPEPEGAATPPGGDEPAPGQGWAALAAAPPVVPGPPVSPLAASASRVVVLAPRSVPRDAREDAVALLREGGWPAEDPGSSPYTISRTHVRYYHAEDRPAAEELAAIFTTTARDFTGYARKPETGMLELWLAGRAPVRRVEASRPALPPPIQAVANVLNRLAQGNRSRD